MGQHWTMIRGLSRATNHEMLAVGVKQAITPSVSMAAILLMACAHL